MSDRRVASRYAKSLIELAEEKGILEEVNSDMLLISSVSKNNRDFELALKNPIVSNDKKLRILQEIFGKKVSKLTNYFFEVVSRKNREMTLPTIAEEFHDLYNKHKGVVHATVTTTFPIGEPLRKKFKEVVKEYFGKDAELEEKIDESIVGGFILKVGDKQLDESLSSKLNELMFEFSHAHQHYLKEI